MGPVIAALLVVVSALVAGLGFARYILPQQMRQAASQELALPRREPRQELDAFGQTPRLNPPGERLKPAATSLVPAVAPPSPLKPARLPSYEQGYSAQEFESALSDQRLTGRRR